MSSVHPDAQISDGHMLPLEGVDCDQQEVVLKSLWQLVRCGKIAEAQLLASRHRLFWLAASLLGVGHPYYEQQQQQSVSGAHGQERSAETETEAERVETEVGSGSVATYQKGNVRRPVWLRTCWKHAEKLHANSGNWGQANKVSQEAK
jgi:hypothetical protein